jgi:hypothetical protein
MKSNDLEQEFCALFEYGLRNFLSIVAQKKLNNL